MGQGQVLADKEPVARLTRADWAVLAGTAILAVALRVNTGLRRDLWEDEVISAQHAVDSAWIMPVKVMRDDVHPFLYFLQLHFWSSISGSDLFLRLNSTVLSLIGIVLFYFVLRRLYGGSTALAGSFLLAVSAPMVWLSQELRPYCWLLVLYVGAFYAIEMACRTAFIVRRYLAWAWILCVALAYSHSLGSLIVLLLGCYALIRLAQEGLERRTAVAWLILFGSCALAAVPPLVNDLARDANLGESSLMHNLLHWPSDLLLPRAGSDALVILAGGVYAGIAVAGLQCRDTRLITATFVVTPLLLALGLGAVGAAIFKQNIFSLITNPFVVLVLARLLVRWPVQWRMPSTALAGTVSLVFCWSFFANRVSTTGYLQVGHFITAHAEPGDLVYAPQASMFYGVARYMSDWTEVLDARAGPATTARWQRVYDRLGPWFVTMFQLEPKTQLVQPATGPALLVGNESIATAEQARRVWLVTYARNDLPPGFPPSAIGSLRSKDEHSFGFLQLRLYQ